MNTTLKYDPEDIESLLRHKQFHELYPEEKEFVLRHVEGEEEYLSLRSTLFLMQDSAKNDDWLEPDASIKQNLMLQFTREEKKGFFIWLNSLFAMPQMPQIVWYKRPTLRYAFAAIMLLVGISGALFLFNNNIKVEMAEANEKTIQLQDTETDKEEDNNQILERPAYADNNQHQIFPPSPAPVLVEFAAARSESQVPASAAFDVEESESKDESIALNDDAAVPVDEVALVDKNEKSTDDLQAIKLANKAANFDEENEDIQRTVAEEKKATSKEMVDSKMFEKDIEKASATLPQNSFNNVPIAAGSEQGNANCASVQAVTISTEAISSIGWSNDGDVAIFTPAKSASAASIKDVLDVLFTAK